jgi:hypothetical protein
MSAKTLMSLVDVSLAIGHLLASKPILSDYKSGDFITLLALGGLPLREVLDQRASISVRALLGITRQARRFCFFKSHRPGADARVAAALRGWADKPRRAGPSAAAHLGQNRRRECPNHLAKCDPNDPPRFRYSWRPLGPWPY